MKFIMTLVMAYIGMPLIDIIFFLVLLPLMFVHSIYRDIKRDERYTKSLIKDLRTNILPCTIDYFKMYIRFKAHKSKTEM